MTDHLIHFIGDIHGKTEVVEAALGLPGTKVFVGDFMDSFDRSPEDHARCLDLVLDTGDDVVCLYGNHELSYMHPLMRCSGYSRAMEQVFAARWARIYEKFDFYYLVEPDLLVTHAGLTRQLWEEMECDIEELPDVLERLCASASAGPFYDIGRARGGFASFGGPLWCDYQYEFLPVHGLRQVFGHTRRGERNGVRTSDGLNWCIDCLDWRPEILTYDTLTKTFRVQKLELTA